MKDSVKDRILIVEDDEDTRLILKTLLVKNSYEVEICSDGQSALELIPEFKPKVIVADWTMPVLDGITLCSILKKDESYKFIYFILLTARSSLKDKVVGLDLGADDFLIKPVENQELLARIRSGVRIYDLQEELKKSEHNRALVEMACTIGHEFNNPLQVLFSNIDIIKDVVEKDNNTLLSGELELIEKSGKRITEIVRRLQNIQNPEVIDYALNIKMFKV